MDDTGAVTEPATGTLLALSKLKVIVPPVSGPLIGPLLSETVTSRFTDVVLDDTVSAGGEKTKLRAAFAALNSTAPMSMMLSTTLLVPALTTWLPGSNG